MFNKKHTFQSVFLAENFFNILIAVTIIDRRNFHDVYCYDALIFFLSTYFHFYLYKINLRNEREINFHIPSVKEIHDERETA